MRIQSIALSALLISAAFALPVLAASAPELPAIPTAFGSAVSETVWANTLRPDDLDAGKKSVALAIDEAGESNEDLLGLAFHPEFGMGTDHDFVFVAFAYDIGTSGAENDKRSRIVQYQWDAEAGRLTDPVELRSNIPAGAGEKG